MTAMSAPDSGVTVRMYRVGLGDAFLLAFRDEDGEPWFVMIDCGVFTGTTGGAARLEAVARDVTEATGGHLHVLVATHEHWDHISGFKLKDALETFQALTIDETWFAWTEDERDRQAVELGEGRFERLQALRAASRALAARGSDRHRAVDRVLDFFELSSNTEKAMKAIRELSTDRRYWEPGDCLVIPGVPGVEIYVLGPPRDARLHDPDPSSGADSEVYHLARRDRAADGFHVAALAAAPEPDDPEDVLPLDADADRVAEQCPFPAWVGGTLAEAEGGAFLQAHYGPPDGDEAWRRIDDDWLRAAEDLALQLDDETNNTSLVLAIRLVGSGKVLLFPGDAQVGNCLSWHDLEWEWTLDDGSLDRVDAEQLLRNTVFYKVGHHGSHNATLRELGLEMMTHPELMAFVPTDEEWTWDKRTWTMPFPPLYRRLLERARGRVIQGISGFADAKPDMLATFDDWDRYTQSDYDALRALIDGEFADEIAELKTRVTVDDLYFEVTIEDE